MNPRPAGNPRIAIVGAGFSGLCLGIQLQKAGLTRFTIFERESRLGGTWRDNTYPGAACDSPSFGYCFSFEQKTDWSRKWSPQPEILAYLEMCARKYGLEPHLRLSTEIAEARFDAERAVWRLRTAAGEEIEADILIAAVGQLNRPHVPALRGLERFRGERFHSARWNHGYDVSGRTVAVIGNAASAIQFIPEIAPRVERLVVFQRSANWMLPRFDRAYTEAEQRRFARHPWLARLYRWWIWASFEARWPVFRGNRLLRRHLQQFAVRSMREQVADPKLQDALVPDYPIGGKRILISDDYYRALGRPNVRVVTSGIDHLTEGAVVTQDGQAFPVDAVILATGFETTSFLVPMRIEGRDGRTLEAEWRDGAHAYLGISVAGFPNFFMTYGPNTNLGHNSIIFMIECQTAYIVDAIRQLAQRGLRWIDVRRDAMERFDAALQTELSQTVWAETPRSWYKNAAGRITNNWSGTTTRYWWKTRRADLSIYEQQPRA